MSGWEFRELSLEHHGSGPQVFACEVLLKANGRSNRRWLNVDGLRLADGKIMLNKAEALRQAALHAGLDPDAVANELMAWVASQEALAQRELPAAAGAE